MNARESSETRDTLLLAGGLAFVVFGAGMLLASPVIRRTVLGSLTPLLPGQDGSNAALAGFLPDVERYLKLKAM
jgi:hypothetical protein